MAVNDFILLLLRSSTQADITRFLRVCRSGHFSALSNTLVHEDSLIKNKPGTERGIVLVVSLCSSICLPACIERIKYARKRLCGRR